MGFQALAWRGNADTTFKAITETHPLPVQSDASASGGYTPGHLLSAASTNATSLKASAGTLGWLVAYNLASTPRYVRFYNKASAPVPGTDSALVVQTFLVPANSTPANGAGIVLGLPPQGLAFSAGIAYTITGALADNDATAVAANDVILNYGYA